MCHRDCYSSRCPRIVRSRDWAVFGMVQVCNSTSRQFGVTPNSVYLVASPFASEFSRHCHTYQNCPEHPFRTKDTFQLLRKPL